MVHSSAAKVNHDITAEEVINSSQFGSSVEPPPTQISDQRQVENFFLTFFEFRGEHDTWLLCLSFLTLLASFSGKHLGGKTCLFHSEPMKT